MVESVSSSRARDSEIPFQPVCVLRHALRLFAQVPICINNTFPSDQASDLLHNQNPAGKPTGNRGGPHADWASPLPAPAEQPDTEQAATATNHPAVRRLQTARRQRWVHRVVRQVRLGRYWTEGQHGILYDVTAAAAADRGFSSGAESDVTRLRRAGVAATSPSWPRAICGTAGRADPGTAQTGAERAPTVTCCRPPPGTGLLEGHRTVETSSEYPLNLLVRCSFCYSKLPLLILTEKGINAYSKYLTSCQFKSIFPKLGKMWWVVSQIWLNSYSNELSQSWVRLVNLGFELSRSWVRLANLGFELSRSWVTWIVIWVRVESARKNESSTTLDRSIQHTFLKNSNKWDEVSTNLKASHKSRSTISHM